MAAMAAIPVTTSLRRGQAQTVPLSTPLPEQLSETLRREAEAHPHLRLYLERLDIAAIGVPEYHPRLIGKLRGLKNPNLIYPVGDGIYIHVYPNRQDSRDHYVAVEPDFGVDLAELMAAVETRLADVLARIEDPADAADRIQILLQAVDRICVVKERGGARLSSTKGGKVICTDRELVALKYRMVRDKEYSGCLEPLLRDPNIEDISCSGLGALFVEHKILGSLKASIQFESHEDLDGFVVALSEKIGRPVTYRAPIVDATLLDGSRINIVFGDEVSRRGSNFTIRKFAETPLSVLDLVEFGSVNYDILAYLSLVIGEGMNLFVSGETASGKTTLMNAITTFIPPSAKIVSIEDTPELQVPHDNWTREVVRGAGNAGGAAVGMFDLLKAALRQRPNEIMIGEIRGEEGAIAFQAMQTGHACMATFHAATVEKLIQRLTGNPINVPKTYIDNLNVVVIQSAVRLPDGRGARRVLSINEIIGYDSASDSFSYIEVFRWNPAEDRFEFTGYMNSYLLEYKIALQRGIPPHEKRKIYDQLKQRAGILRRLHRKGVTGFHELYRVLGKAHREGIFR